MMDGTYSILLIEDDEKDSRSIRRTIKGWCLANQEGSTFQLEFLDLSFFGEKKDFNGVFEAVIDSINENKIDAVIIDFKMESSVVTLNGAHLYKKLHEAIPQFPFVILTNKYDDCYDADAVDCDKIYDKATFLKAGEEESNRLVKNFLSNIVKYAKEKANLENQISILGQRKNGFEDPEYLELERQYDLYISDRPIWPLDKAVEERMFPRFNDLLERVEKILEKHGTND